MVACMEAAQVKLNLIIVQNQRFCEGYVNTSILYSWIELLSKIPLLYKLRSKRKKDKLYKRNMKKCHLSQGTEILFLRSYFRVEFFLLLKKGLPNWNKMPSYIPVTENSPWIQIYYSTCNFRAFSLVSFQESIQLGAAITIGFVSLPVSFSYFLIPQLESLKQNEHVSEIYRMLFSEEVGLVHQLQI